MRLVVAAALAVWEPVSFLAVAGVFPSLPARGPAAIVEFIWAALAAFIGVAAAWALATRAPAAVPLARLAIAVAGVRELQRLVWTHLPSDVIPGTEPRIAAIVVIVAAGLFAASGARLGAGLRNDGR